MCTLVWMKITQNRPDQNIILFYSLFFEHSMHIFQIVCSRQSELLKNGMCNTRVVLTEGFFTVHSIYDERGSEVAKWPSWSDQVIVLSQNHMLPSNFSVTTMREKCIAGGYTGLSGYRATTVTAKASLRLDQPVEHRGYTPRSGPCHSISDSIISAWSITEYFNHKAASLQTHTISPCKLANINVRSELSLLQTHILEASNAPRTKSFSF